QEAAMRQRERVTIKRNATGASARDDGAGSSVPAVTPEGVMFTIEAPDAERVQLAGDFNNWTLDGNEMEAMDGVGKKVVRLPPEPSPARPGSRGGVALRRPAPITRDRLAADQMKCDGALEEGLRAFDAKIPCPSCGEIDLLAVDRASQLTIIDFEMTFDDSLL